MKSCNTNQGKIDIHMDNIEAWRRIESTTKVANHFHQDSSTEIKAIKRIMKEEDLNIMLKRKPGYREVRQTFQKNPVPILIEICDKEVKKVQTKVTDKETSNKMRHYGDQVILKEGQLSSLPVKEPIREVVTEEEEDNCTKKKLNERADLFDKKARINIMNF